MTAKDFFTASNVEAIRTVDCDEGTIQRLIKQGFLMSEKECCLSSPSIKGRQSCRDCDPRWRMWGLKDE